MEISWTTSILKNYLCNSGETKSRPWPREYKWKTDILFDKINSKKKGQSSLIHKIENMLDVIYDNFDCPLFVAKYHPAGYSFEYSTGRKFSSRYSAGTILLLIKQKIKHDSQNESYLTRQHTKVFQNIKLASFIQSQ